MNDVASFSWDFHAYDLFSKFLPELTDAIQNQMAYAFNMTKHTYGAQSENIAASYFRQCIFEYMQMIYGIRDD
ncbi:MAG: hypothetical protein ACMG6E_08135 [Candidatus Roizmanbacteria bacterium]